MILDKLLTIKQLFIGIQVFIILCACSTPKDQKAINNLLTYKSTEVPKLQSIMESNKLVGTILIFDEAKKEFYANDFAQISKTSLPASTFKIANSIIGLEIGLLENQNSIFKWDGAKRMMKSWEKDLTLKQAFQRSCVPCYQELARGIGLKNMRSYLEKIGYEGMDVNIDNLESFWLIGNSNISPQQQIDFLRNLANNKLPISEKTFNTMMEIMIVEETHNYTLRAKTGLSVGKGRDLSWYVGWLQIDNNKIYFATRLSPERSNMDRNKFLPLRKEITLEALQYLKYM